MGTTNYQGTFIQVAEDCPVRNAAIPPDNGKNPTVASLQHAIISEHPYELTSDDVLFEVYALRQGVLDEEREAAREAFFARDQACLRSSPLGKRYGWGIHHDSEGRVALVPVDSEQYVAHVGDTSLRQLKAMRSKRA